MVVHLVTTVDIRVTIPLGTSLILLVPAHEAIIRHIFMLNDTFAFGMHYKSFMSFFRC